MDLLRPPPSMMEASTGGAHAATWLLAAPQNPTHGVPGSGQAPLDRHNDPFNSSFPF